MALTTCKTCGKRFNKKLNRCPGCRAPVANNKMNYVAWGISIIVVLFLLNHFSGDLKKLIDLGSSDVPDYVEIDINWDANSGNVARADITLKNGSEFDLKDIEFVCTHYDQYGQRVGGKEHTVFGRVSAYGQKEIPNFSMGFKHDNTDLTECEVTDVTVL